MVFQRVNREHAEKVFLMVKNNEGSALAAGQTVQWELASASVDGVKARGVDTGNDWAFIGIVDAAIADGEYGLVQVYGYRASAKVFQTGTSYDTGAALVPVAGQAYMSAVATSTTSTANVTLQPVFAVLAESIQTAAASATVARKVFLRAL
jgi:hypothetical protein